jgi:hypothetical protein
MSTTETPEPAIVADARALGVKLASDSKSYITGLLTTVGTDVEAVVPAIEGDAANYAASFLPAAMKTEVSTLAGLAVSALAPESVTLLKTAWGAALTRIEAVIP